LDGVHRSIQMLYVAAQAVVILLSRRRLRLNEEHRSLALVLPRIADRTNSELAGVWHEGRDGAQFDAAIEHLRSRLEAASKGPRELAKPKAGDANALQATLAHAAAIQKTPSKPVVRKCRKIDLFKRPVPPC